MLILLIHKAITSSIYQRERASLVWSAESTSTYEYTLPTYKNLFFCQNGEDLSEWSRRVHSCTDVEENEI